MKIDFVEEKDKDGKSILVMKDDKNDLSLEKQSRTRYLLRNNKNGLEYGDITSDRATYLIARIREV